MAKIKHFFLEFMTYHKSERNGIFVLLSIIVVMLLYLSFSHLFYTPAKIDFTKFEHQLKVFSDSINTQNDSSESKTENFKHYTSFSQTDKSIEIKGERFNFNPNNLSEENWKRLGLSDKQIQVIKNYESKGGKFKTKEDVKKMYCIQQKLYTSLEPFIVIPEIQKDTIKSKYVKKDTAKSSIILVELNTADSSALIKIRGIKGFYASKIIEYRNQLGGYISKEQLMELWKFDQEKYDAIEKYVTVNPSSIKKININTATAKELKHPYLSWKIVNGIISYRSKHGKFSTIEEIRKTDLVDDETYRKIGPYLKVE